MKAVRALLALPYRRMPVAAALVMLLPLAGLVFALVFSGRAGIGMMVATFMTLGSWMWQLCFGSCLRSVCRRESQLMPGFQARVLQAVGVQFVLWVGVPLLFVTYAGAPAHTALALLLTGAALGLAAGIDPRMSMVAWLVVALMSWQPAFIAPVTRWLVRSAWNPLPAIALAVGVVLFLRYRLFAIDDEPEALSPMDAAESGRRPTLTSDDTTQRRGWLSRKLAPVFDGAAQHALDSSLRRWRGGASAARRVALLRAVLLPHDNARAVLLRLALVSLFIVLYMFIFRFGRNLDAGVVGAYAVLLGVSRMIAVGHGTLHMRPHLAELYLTLAPPSDESFQTDIERALRRLLIVSVLSTFAYAALGGVVLHAADPARLLLAAAIAGLSAALTAFGVQLIVVDSRVGRVLIGLALSLGAMAAYALAYALIGGLGYVGGGQLSPLIEMTIGDCAWRAGRGTFIARRPRFDVPL